MKNVITVSSSSKLFSYVIRQTHRTINWGAICGVGALNYIDTKLCL